MAITKKESKLISGLINSLMVSKSFIKDSTGDDKQYWMDRFDSTALELRELKINVATHKETYIQWVLSTKEERV